MSEFNFEILAVSAFQSARINFDQFENSENWVVANRLFRIGRTNSINYCHHLGIDPDGKTMEKVSDKDTFEA